jgi:hypothetical protein
MNVGGWVLMLLSWAAILALFVFSLTRTLREKDEEPESEGQRPSADGDPPQKSKT